MENILYFGGSFNPIHNGHLLMCERAIELFNFNKVILIPAKNPYHKNTYMLDYDNRLKIIKQTINGFSFYDVSEIERDFTGNSYAIDVIERLNTTSKINYLIGADSFINIHKWHRFEDLKKKVHFIVARRNSIEIPSLDVDYKVFDYNINISSTDVRKRIKDGKSLFGIIPHTSYDLILNIYKDVDKSFL